MLANGTHENPQTTQAIPKSIGCSPQTDSKALVLNTTLALIHWTQRRQAGAYLELLSLLTSIHGSGRYFPCYQRRKVNTNLSIYNNDLPARNAGVIVTQKLWEYNCQTVRSLCWNEIQCDHEPPTQPKLCILSTWFQCREQNSKDQLTDLEVFLWRN